MNETNLLENYRPIVGDEAIKKIRKKARKLKNKHIVCISSTHTGGGVAEMLNAMIPILNDEGIKFGWRILHGTNNFFEITKGIHDSLQGGEYNLTDRKKQLYYETNRRFSKFTHLDHDLVIVHDPQPMPIVDFYEKRQPWILRLHIDITRPDKEVYNYVKDYINKYDHVIVSKKEYIKKSILKPQSIIYPAIDPLSIKNMDLTSAQINNQLEKKGIKRNKLMITEVSRFDKWKGFPGLIKAFEKARKEIDSQLVLCGVYASDDPDGEGVYKEIVRMVSGSKYKKDIKIIFGGDEIFVNAIQRASDIVVQNSIKEGFGLTVSEALYKETPVIASDVGGISLQIENGKNGILYKPNDTEALSAAIITLAKDEKLREEMGKNGKEYVIKNFLITRLIIDWLELISSYLIFPGNIKYITGSIITKITNNNFKIT